MTESVPDVVVVGGGIIGLAGARALREQGLSVEVLDTGPSRKRASLAAAGLLAPLSHQIAPDAAGQACLESKTLWPAWHSALTEATGETIELDASGAILTAAAEDQLATLDRVIAMAEAIGERWEEMATADALEKIPDLRPDIERAVLLPDELRVDNVAVVRALEAACQADGISILRGRTVLGVRRLDDGIELETNLGPREAPRAVLAAGCWTARIEGCGPLPIRPVRGQMIRYDGVRWPWRSMVRVGDYYAVRRGADSVLFGATVEEAGFDDRTTYEGLESLGSAFEQAFPSLATRPRAAAWSGLRPGTADGRPTVGRWRDWPLFVAAGHHRDGILLAPWTAACIAAWARDESWEAPAALSPDRFADR